MGIPFKEKNIFGSVLNPADDAGGGAAVHGHRLHPPAPDGDSSGAFRQRGGQACHRHPEHPAAPGAGCSAGTGAHRAAPQ